MPQPPITLSDGITILTLDPDLRWTDEFAWGRIEQATERSIGGALIVDVAVNIAGRPITLKNPADNAAWMRRAVLSQLQAWEALPSQRFTLNLRGTPYIVIFDRSNGAAIEAEPVEFVADPEPGGFGDWYLCTLRFLTVE